MSPSSRTTLLAFALSLAPTPLALAQSAPCPDAVLRTLDLTTRPTISGVTSFAPAILNDRAYFPANPLGLGVGLWRTDGAESGTQEVISPAQLGTSVASMLGASGDAVYFLTTSPARVFRSDGTPGGGGTMEIDPAYSALQMSYGGPFFAAVGPTALYASNGQLFGVKTINGAPVRTALRAVQNFKLRAPAVLNDRVLFATWDDDLDASSLYSSDGTAEGTILLHAWSGAGTVFAQCEDLYVANNLAFFRAGDAEYGGELWCTDGTPTGTRRLADLNPGHGTGSAFIYGAAGNKLYFSGSDFNGSTLFGWSDGVSVSIINGYYGGGVSGRANNFPRILDLSGRAVFAGGISSNGTTGREPHITDGTLPGTQLLADAILGTEGSAYSQDSSGVVIPNPGGAAGAPRALFSLRINNVEQLWSTNGTPAGTFYLCDRVTGSSWFLETDGRYAYFPRTPVSTPQLWVTDGTLEGTRVLNDPTRNAPIEFPTRPYLLNGQLVFTCSDARYGSELWTTDGSDANTRLIKEIGTGTTASNFGGLAPRDDRSVLLYSRADSLTALREWDGRHTPTIVGSASSLISTPRKSAVINDRFFIDGLSSVLTCDLFGTALAPLARSTQVNSVADFAPISTSSGQRIIYAGQSIPPAGVEPFVSDGTPAGSSQLLDIVPGTGSSSPGYFYPLRNLVLFSATNPATGYEWWATDGTPAGTILLGDLLPGPNSGQRPSSQDQQPTRPTILKGATPADDLAFFLSVTSNLPNTTTFALYRTDGTVPGTLPLETGAIVPGPPVAAAAGLVFFNASVPGQGIEIYATDGTPGATHLLQDFTPGTGSTFLDTVFDAGDRAFIELYRSTAHELWVYNRTNQSLTQVLNGSLGGSPLRDVFPGHVVAPDGRVYFGARTDSGHVIARTDGTPGGTCIVARLTAPNTVTTGVTLPTHLLTRAGSRIFFIGTDPTLGLEPRVIDLCPADYNNSGAVSLQDLFDFLADWFAADPAANFNTDPTISLQDLFDFLAAWFAGC